MTYLWQICVNSNMWYKTDATKLHTAVSRVLESDYDKLEKVNLQASKVSDTTVIDAWIKTQNEHRITSSTYGYTLLSRKGITIKRTFIKKEEAKS